LLGYYCAPTLATAFMIRKKLFSKAGKRTIRGTEIYRIEALSDAVFAFSVSLLIMSLEVPKTFEELKQIIIQFFPFLATVSLVFFFWYLQNDYFRSYALNAQSVVVLNLALLIIILFYAFPLKFLFSVLLGWITGINYFEEITQQGKTVLSQQEFPYLILFFSTGYAVIWLIFYRLYVIAFANRKLLDLTAYEHQYLLSQKRDAVVQMFIGVLSAVFALSGYLQLSGFCFMLIPVWLLLNAYLFKRKLKKLQIH
jgi:uncharacterized membrane protein